MHFCHCGAPRPVGTQDTSTHILFVSREPQYQLCITWEYLRSYYQKTEAKSISLIYTHIYIKLSLLLRWIGSQLTKQQLILQLTIHPTAVNQQISAQLYVLLRVLQLLHERLSCAHSQCMSRNDVQELLQPPGKLSCL